MRKPRWRMQARREFLAKRRAAKLSAKAQAAALRKEARADGPLPTEMAPQGRTVREGGFWQRLGAGKLLRVREQTAIALYTSGDCKTFKEACQKAGYAKVPKGFYDRLKPGGDMHGAALVALQRRGLTLDAAAAKILEMLDAYSVEVKTTYVTGEHGEQVKERVVKKTGDHASQRWATERILELHGVGFRDPEGVTPPVMIIVKGVDPSALRPVATIPGELNVKVLPKVGQHGGTNGG